MRDVTICTHAWPLKAPFRISRGVKTQAETISVTITEKGFTGRGECVPYARYGESIETVSASIEQLIPMIKNGLDRDALQSALYPGAARNAIDCALWDLTCKQEGKSIYDLLSMTPPKPLLTAVTLSLDTAGKMAQAARQLAHHPLIKVKCGAPEGLAADIDRLEAIRAVLPEHRLIIDANEAWSAKELRIHAAALHALAPELIEQPLASSLDAELEDIDLPFCADESLHDRHDLASLNAAYRWINIKLDKAGGLTEALAMVELAQQAQLKIMVGCMVASSLAMAPACILAQYADLVDLDGSLLLAEDVSPELTIDNSLIAPVPSGLWG